MGELNDRLGNLTPEQRRLLDMRLRERGLSPERDSGLASARTESSSSAAASAAAWRAQPPRRPMGFSLYFFSNDGDGTGEKYALLLDAARFADASGFEAVWIPERHFQPFGGLHPNPAVVAAALAVVTHRIGIRAGSVALPLHSPLRVAEEWAVVDRLSGGRISISFASGWHPDDFVLYPTPYEQRKDVMFRGIQTVRHLWAGGSVSLEGPEGAVEVRTLPRPVQAELPVWVTTAGSVSTWERAGSIGANVFAALVGYSLDELGERIGLYRRARAAAGRDPASGRVTIVAHTYVGTDDAAVRELVRQPMTGYLEGYLGQFRNRNMEPTGTSRDAREVAGLAFEQFFADRTLLGSPSKCAQVVEALSDCGADELACLIDFGLEAETVLAGLPRLGELCEHWARPGGRDEEFDDAAAIGAVTRSGDAGPGAPPNRDHQRGTSP